MTRRPPHVRVLSVPLLELLLLLVFETSAQITGGGSLAAAPLIERALSQLSGRDSSFSGSYVASYGSTALHQLANGTGDLDFAVSEAALKPQEYKAHAEAHIAYVPFQISTLAISANLPGIGYRSLYFDADALARIYSCNITRWRDDRLIELNPRYSFPNATIVPLARTDIQSQTRGLERYLNTSEAWPLRRPGRGLGHGPWPFRCLRLVHGVKGDAGMSHALRSTPYAIGYDNAHEADSNDLAIASLRNRAGRFVAPVEATYDGLTSALHLPDRAASPLWHIVDLTSPKLPHAYAISAFDFLAFRQHDRDPNTTKGQQLTQLLNFVQSSAMDIISLNNGFRNLPLEAKQVDYVKPVDPRVLAAIPDAPPPGPGPGPAPAVPIFLQGAPTPDPTAANPAAGPAPSPDPDGLAVPERRAFPTWKIIAVTAGSVAGAALLLAGACLLRFLFWQRKRQREDEAEELEQGWKGGEYKQQAPARRNGLLQGKEGLLNGGLGEGQPQALELPPKAQV